MLIEDLIKMIKNKDIKYQILILCFPKSSKLIEDLNNAVDYLIAFENFDNFKDEKSFMKKYNNESIQFLIDFITKIVNNKDNKEYDTIFQTARETFLNNIKDIKNQIKSKEYIISIKGKNYINSKIIFQNNFKTKKVFLYGSFPKLEFFNYEDNGSKDYTSDICKLVEYFNHENLKIFYCNNSNDKYYLHISLEIMKFFYRHKTFCELFNIDLNKELDKNILKSLIRKLKEIKNEDNEKDENEEDEGDIQQKACFILIYNCNLKDILDINLYSVINSCNSSFIIIYNEEIFSDYKKVDKTNISFNETNEEMKFDLIENSNKFEKSANEIKEEKEKVFKFIFKDEDQIGAGQHSNIYLARNKEEKEGDKKLYVIKIPKEDQMDNMHRLNFNNEIEILNTLSKIPNNKYTPIVYDYKKFEVNILEKEKKERENNNEFVEERDENNINKPYYVMDYFSKGLLYYYIVTQGRPSLKEKHKKFIFKKIIEAYKFLYDHNICHLNLKPDNIILDKDFLPIIIDFFYSKKTQDENGNLILLSTDVIAGDYYSAPEIWKGINFIGEKADIFSLGAILFSLVTMREGFESSRTNDQLYKLIMKKDYNKYWITRNIHNLSNDFKDLYLKMIAYNPDERPSCDEILNHLWFDEVNNLSQEEEEQIKTELKEIYNIMVNKERISTDEKIRKDHLTTR